MYVSWIITSETAPSFLQSVSFSNFIADLNTHYPSSFQEFESEVIYYCVPSNNEKLQLEAFQVITKSKSLKL